MNIGSSITCILVSSFGFYNLGSTLGALKVNQVLHKQLPIQETTNAECQNHDLLMQTITFSNGSEEPISSPTNNMMMPSPSSTSSSSSSSSSMSVPQIQPRTTLPIFKDSSSSSNRQLLLRREQQEEDIKQSELLVHPAMLVHEDSETVVVITSSSNDASSSGENLRTELRKHRTLERTYMIDSHQKEEMILKKLRKNLKKNEEGIDVVLIEESDDSESSTSSPLAFASKWHQVLEPNDGILALRLNSYSSLARRVEELEDAGFERIIDYSVRSSSSQSSSRRRTTHGDSTYFLLAFSTEEGIAEWHTNEASWNLKMRQRLKEDPSAELQYIDSATMIQLEYPSKRSALLHCPINEEITSIQEECVQYSSGFDSTLKDYPLEAFVVAKSGVGDNAGRGVFAAIDIPANSYLNLKAAVHPVKANWKATTIINGLLESSKIYQQIENLYSYLDGYGYVDEPWGEEQYSVESDLMLFVNHGCNGTMNVGWESLFSEQTIDLDAVKKNREKYWFDDYDVSYDPMTERTMGYSSSVGASNFKDLKKGDELLENYMAFFSFDDIEESSMQLLNECNGGAGYVEQYQDSEKGSFNKAYVFTAIGELVDGDPTDSASAESVTVAVNNHHRMEELDNQTKDHRQ